MKNDLDWTFSEQSELVLSWTNKLKNLEPGRVWVETWDFLRKEGKGYAQIKGCGPERNTLESAIEISAKFERNSLDISAGCSVIRDLSTYDIWKSSKTLPVNSTNKIEVEFGVKKGDSVTLSDEGKFRVYDVLNTGLYSENPWVKLVSLEKDYIIAMSLNTLRRKLSMKEHKRLNYPILSDIDNMSSYWRTIGYLLKHSAALHIRTTPKTHNKVIEAYEGLVGGNIPKEIKEKYLKKNPNLETFTDNAHLYFPVFSEEAREKLWFPPNKKGKQEGEIISGDIEKLHNTEFVWTLFSYGFRLGTQHDEKIVRNHIKINAEEFFAAFEEGVSGL